MNQLFVGIRKVMESTSTPVNYVAGVGSLIAVLLPFLAPLLVPQGLVLESQLFSREAPTAANATYTYILKNLDSAPFTQELDFECSSCAVIGARQSANIAGEPVAAPAGVLQYGALKVQPIAATAWQIPRLYVPAGETVMLSVDVAGPTPDLRISRPSVYPVISEKTVKILTQLSYSALFVVILIGFVWGLAFRRHHRRVQQKLTDVDDSQEKRLAELQDKIASIEAGGNQRVLIEYSKRLEALERYLNPQIAKSVTAENARRVIDEVENSNARPRRRRDAVSPDFVDIRRNADKEFFGRYPFFEQTKRDH